MLALLALLDAQAYTLACGEAQLVGTLPAPSAEDVPTDARISLQFRGCEEAARPALVRLEAIGADGERAVVLEAEVEPAVMPDLAALTVESLSVEGGLAPLTEHLLTVDDALYVHETSFRTGAGPSEPLTGQIDAEMGAWAWSGRDEATRLNVQTLPVADPYGLSLVELLDPADPSVVYGGSLLFDSEAVWVTGNVPAERRPDEVCVRAVQRDGAGRQVGDGVDLCAEPDRVGRCATTPVGSAWLALVGLAVQRRRRARTSAAASQA